MAASAAPRLDRTQVRKPTAERRVIQYKRPPLAKYQEDAIFSPHRYGIVEASTKAGKTTGCLIWLLEEALLLGQPGRNFWWVSPVFAQADDCYNRMMRAIPKHLYKSHEGEHTVTLVNGAVIHFKSADRPDTLYGVDVFAAVIDEASRMKMAVWLAIRSTLTFTQGRVRIIGNVKGRKNWAFKLARRAEAEKGTGTMQFARITAFDAVAAGILAMEEIEDARGMLTEEEFNELYLAEAPRDETQIYTSFSDANVTDAAKDNGGPLLIGMDFNVDPMTCCIATAAGDQTHIFDEITIRNADTELMCQRIRQKYPNRDITVYPDPSGKRRITSARAGATDFSIIREYKMKISAPSRAMAVVDRINCVNRAFKDARGRTLVYVNPKCSKVIVSFDEQEYKQGTREPDKSGGHDHMTDAAGYLISRRHPIVKNRIGTADLDL
jgi:hypothetical protein